MRWRASETGFDRDRLMQGLRGWVATPGEQGNERLKGTLRTDQGWMLVEVAQGQLYSRPFTDQELNRVDWILSGSDEPEAVILAAMIEA